MIPLRLQIKNFLSYGADIQTMDFEPYQLICLSGKNGHGKSALLDAITWALWGNARKISGTAKADEGILRLGQTQMMVVLDFECNSQKYRVKREYVKTYGKPLLTLDFGVYQPDGSLVSLTENRLRATQQKIEQTINLTMESFVNSAFLRQGQANEFSKKSPKDRKEIFAQILGLQEYELIKKLALEKAKQAIIERESTQKFQEKIEAELQKKEEIAKTIQELEAQLLHIAKQEQKAANAQLTLAEHKKQLTQEQQQLNMLQFKLEQLKKKETEQQHELLATRNQWRTVHKMQWELPDQLLLEKGKKGLIDQINKHQQILQKKLQLKESYLKNKEHTQKIEKNFYQAFSQSVQDKKLETEKLQISLVAEEKSFKELLKKRCDNNNEKKQANELIKKLQDTVSLHLITKKELKIQEQQFEKRKEHYQKYITQGNWIKKELDNLQQKQTLSQGQSPCCPLCEQNLSASRKRFLTAKFQKQEGFLVHRFARLSRLIQNLKEQLIKQHKTVEKLKEAHDKNKLHEVRIKELEKRSQDLDRDTKEIAKKISTTQKNQKELCKQLEKETKNLKKIELEGKDKLQKNPRYKKLLGQITKDLQAAQKLQYDQTVHAAATQKLQDIEKQLANYETMREQISLQAERTKKVAQLCVSLKGIKKEKNELHKKCETYKDLEEKQKKITTQENAIIAQLKGVNIEKEQLLQKKGGLENQKIKLKQLEKEFDEQQKAIKKLENDIDDYKAIATATGKNGIQALLIENAIPEIEAEANNILSKLTNNQAQIFIESLRDLKKGGTKETLDIKISDAAGIRAYELFSGGEAFRIDFALRIAISKLLARRAGTALQTLIIDEGFGSQDEEGLNNIMDAIYKIQDDFSKVIVVSHLPSLKDQFPIHFFVQKGPNGSSVKVIENG